MKQIIILLFLIISITILSAADINVNGYVLHQNGSAQQVTLPDVTIPDGWYLIVGRSATQAVFESEWGALPGNAIYFNSGGSCPQINGGENYYLKNASAVTVDSTLQLLTSGNTAERDSTNVNTWTQSARTDGTPGSGAIGGFDVGLVINEYSDAVTWSNEFVEIYNDGTGSAPNVPPAVSASHNPDPLRDSDNLSIVAIITDDSGIAADTLFGRVNGGAWNSWQHDSIVGNNYYFTDIGAFTEGDVVDYFVRAIDDSSASTYSDTTNVNVLAAQTGDSLNINNYQIKQYSASYTYTFGDITLFDGEYIVIGRNADKAAFETFWNVSLAANVIYINGANSALSINGAETFSLHDATPSLIDSSTSALVGGNTVVRDATNLNTWTQFDDTTGTPGSGVTGGNDAGFVITEYSDASGTGNYIYEFVEVFFDGSGTSSNTPPVMDSMSSSPDFFEPGDAVTFIQYMHDDSGIAQDTFFLKIGDAGSWTGIQKDSIVGQGYYYPIGTFNQYDTIYGYTKAIDDSNAVTLSDTTSHVVDYYTPGFSNNEIDPAIPDAGTTIYSTIDIYDVNGSIVADTLHFTINGGSENTVVAHDTTGTTYHYNFGTFIAGDTVDYYYNAIDDDAHSSQSDPYSFIVIETINRDIKVNEFCSNGPSLGDVTTEWIELYNTGSSSVDVSNYIISDEEGSFKIPSGTTIDANDFFVLMNNTDSFDIYYTLPGGVGSFEYKDSISGSFGLSNSGDQIILYNADTIQIDYVNYGTGTTPAPNPGDSLSATRIPDGTDTDNCTNDFSISSEPSPGSGIISGPTISGVSRSPILPLSTEVDTVRATVTDTDGVFSVELIVTANNPFSIDTFPMSPIGSDVYECIVPAHNDACKIEYDIYAVDNVSDNMFANDVGKFFWGYTSIPTIKAIDANGYPLYYDYQIRSTGIVTTPSNVYSTFADILNFQENYRLGAVLKTDTSATDVIPGDSITATGTIGMWNGQTRIEDPYSGLILHSSGHVIDTIYITADQLMDTVGEDYEGLLCQIYTDGIYSGTWPTPGNSAGLWMNNHDPADISKGNISDTFYMWIDGDTDIDENTEPTWNVRVIGIISQYDVSSPYFGGYQIMPRSYNDVTTSITAIKNFFLTLSLEQNGLTLRWNINGVDNISGFRIERREPRETTYKVLSSVSPNTYSFTDKDVSLDKMYEYRILVITTDGNTLTYKEIRTSLSMLIKQSSASIDNNPVKMGTWLRFVSPRETNLKASLYDISGRNILTISDGIVRAGFTNIFINTSHISSGVYFLKIASSDFNETIKINIIK